MAIIRARFARERPAQWLGPQELVAAIRNAALQAGLPIARARGDRGPWLAQSGPPLGLGHLSQCEYVDLTLTAPCSAAEFAERLRPWLPAGIRLLWQRRLPPGAPLGGREPAWLPPRPPGPEAARTRPG